MCLEMHANGISSPILGWHHKKHTDGCLEMHAIGTQQLVDECPGPMAASAERMSCLWISCMICQLL